MRKGGWLDNEKEAEKFQVGCETGYFEGHQRRSYWRFVVRVPGRRHISVIAKDCRFLNPTRSKANSGLRKQRLCWFMYSQAVDPFDVDVVLPRPSVKPVIAQNLRSVIMRMPLNKLFVKGKFAEREG